MKFDVTVTTNGVDQYNAKVDESMKEGQTRKSRLLAFSSIHFDDSDIMVSNIKLYEVYKVNEQTGETENKLFISMPHTMGIDKETGRRETKDVFFAYKPETRAAMDRAIIGEFQHMVNSEKTYSRGYYDPPALKEINANINEITVTPRKTPPSSERDRSVGMAYITLGGSEGSPEFGIRSISLVPPTTPSREKPIIISSPSEKVFKYNKEDGSYTEAFQNAVVIVSKDKYAQLSQQLYQQLAAKNGIELTNEQQQEQEQTAAARRPHMRSKPR